MKAFVNHSVTILTILLILFFVGNSRAQTTDTKIKVDVKAMDLSLVSLANLKTPTQELIVGGQPSIDDLAILVKNGVKNIINLRGKNEFDGFDEIAEATKLGVNYLHIPIEGAADISIENAERLQAAFSKLEGATLIHCASGNRVGALFALNAAQDRNRSITQAIEEGKAFGLTKLENKVREVLEEQLLKSELNPQ